MSNVKLLKSSGIIGGATVASRVLGFLRDILFARFFGTNIFAQAFVVAFRIPNMLRDLVGEGATNAAIVPVLSEYSHTRSKKEYWEAAQVILNLMLVVLGVLSVSGVIFAPVLVKIIAPGFLRSPEKFDAAVFLTRMIFPYIIFLGMTAYSKGVLNSLHYFTTPAFAPVVLNMTLIAALLVLCPIIGINGLIAGVLIGGVLEVAMQIVPLKKRGFKFGKGFCLVHPVAKRIGILLLPRMVGTAVYQLSVLIDTVLASLAWIVGAGGVAALYYSNRLVQLPLAVFGISLATAALPKMSKEVAGKDIGKLKNTVSFSLKTVFTVMVPAAAGLIVLARPIIRILFQRGEFTEYSTMITSDALFFYSFGLFAYAGIKILVNTYYSMGDTRTPVKTAAVSLFINLVLNLALMYPLKIGGLALATSIAATANFVILYIILTKRIGSINGAEILKTFIQICAASFIMTIVIIILKQMFLQVTGLSSLGMFLRLIIIVFAGSLVYITAAYVIGVEGVRKIIRMTGSR
ncbi:MAG: murein biosynthesis integral membrane protein MurJ [Candidatus Omnitrophota bacterium]